jgi:prepilin-type N-terminal cleavage/methylation domain-containing protein
MGMCTATSRAGPAAGFTLVEMMVVMVLLGLLTTLALPAMQRWHDGVQARAQTMGVVEALRAAAFAAGATRSLRVVDGSSFTTALPAGVPAGNPASDTGAALSPSTPDTDEPPAPPSAALAVPIPSGWQVDRVEPAAFLANGLCRPGRVEFKTPAGARVAIDIGGPTCSVGIADPASGAPQ